MNTSQKKQAFNPYLPLDTYVPDGEPHVFGDRLYVFGSHDKEGGDKYCMLDYEGFSAPLDNLADWRSEGIIYRASQDPTHSEKYSYLYAPDVVQGNDGRYYLYYALSYQSFTGPIHVAVCDTPAGSYEYYGEVRYPDGRTFDRGITFDPGLLNDNGNIYLYYGWAISAPQMRHKTKEELEQIRPTIRQVELSMFEKTEEQLARETDGLQGANVVRLADDMLTVIEGPKRIAPGQVDAAGTPFEGHAFFEASSIRKIVDTYYFIYSSEVCHELCYATSQYPDRDFHYRGVIVSNGDIGYHGIDEEHRLAVTGNDHGSIACVNGQWYIFYHRHTNKTCFSRQGCAEKITILPDGTIPQVEMTSCGLSDGPLAPAGSYPAPIACNLTNDHLPDKIDRETHIAYITCDRGERIIKDISDSFRVGYKYFAFDGPVTLGVVVRGKARGILEIATEDGIIGRLDIAPSENWKTLTAPIAISGTKGLYLTYHGDGAFDMKEFFFA